MFTKAREIQMISQNQNSLATAIRKNVSFVIYRLPGENKTRWMGQNQGDLQMAQELPHEPGFVMYPFDAASTKPVFLKADKQGTLSGSGFDSFVASSAGFKENTLNKQPEFIDRKNYLKILENALYQVKKNGIQKFIFSRIQNVQPLHSSLIPVLYEELQARYPKALVYLFNHPATGLWMGATPEVFLSKTNNAMITHSLAGSQPAKLSGSYKWGTKEIEEQDYVTRYIEQLINTYNLKYAAKGPFTMEAGPVAHLKTTFEIQTQDEMPVWEFIQHLHPTPAVCGLPKTRAKNFILRTESHDRDYYTGFTGPVTQSGDFQLFVNLRCMRITPAGFHIFAGGGITDKSNPRHEWAETVVKMATLQNIIEEIRMKNG